MANGLAANSAICSRSRCGPWFRRIPARQCSPAAKDSLRCRPVPSPPFRDHDARLAEQHGGDALWLACTHGDVIKAVVADALGLHLDGFQRISADPASISVIRYTRLRPFVLHVNHTGARLTSALTPAPASNGETPPDDAVVGGSTE